MSRDASRFACAACGGSFPLDRPRFECDCGGILHLPSLPGDPADLPIDLGLRETPLVEEEIGSRCWRLKVEATLPTGSFKDRGTGLLVNFLARWGVEEVAGDSSGNAAVSLAAWCARAGIRAVLYVPATASPAKLRLIEMYGAEVRRVAGGRAAARDRALEHGRRTFYAGHVTHPLFPHGVKTIAGEMVERLGRRPDSVVVPVGNGTLLLGIDLGFRELLAAGRIDRMPRLFGVQAERCAPLAAPFTTGTAAPDPGATRAEGIAIAAPPRADEIVAAVRHGGGSIVTVSEEEIATAHAALAGRGLLVEPTSAVAYAAAAAGRIDSEGGECPVMVLTGSGLKTL